MTAMLDALELARAGWRVLPCHHSGPKAKAPLLEHGHLEASADPALIRRWWARWPSAMIGAPVPDALLVFDLDPRNGASYEALEAAAGPIPDTLTAWSGRGDGGRHLYFLRPYGELTSTRLPKGIDLKINGYCILPPSIHPASGQPYRWELPLREPAALTQRMRDLLRPAPVSRTPAGRWRGAGTGLVHFVEAAQEGARNRALFWSACRAAESGCLGALEAALLAAACSTGLPEHEARRILASAARRAGR